MHHLRSLKEIHCIAKGPGISKSDANIRILLLLATGLYRGSKKITDISQHKHLQCGKILETRKFWEIWSWYVHPIMFEPTSWFMAAETSSWSYMSHLKNFADSDDESKIATTYHRVETTRCDCFDSYGIKKSSNFLSKDIHHPNLLGVQHIPCKHEAISSVGNGWAGSNSRGLVPQKCDRSTRVPVTSCS